MPTKALDLFQAYAQEKLPRDGGYIVSSFFDPNSSYSRYEVVAYNGVKGISVTEEGLQFQADGNKIFVLVEPPGYPRKHEEPVNRNRSEMIPHRFSELEIFTAKNQTKVMVSKEPVVSYSAFTILRPTGVDFAIVFYNLPDVIASLKSFFTQTLNREAGIPQIDAKHGAESVIQGLKRFTVWET
ncbi:MAG TPA: hypothetical protein VMW69_07050 [Spirochaetia bacterium]|nr:hypothetical protein [Spirochaetia bacterium]